MSERWEKVLALFLFAGGLGVLAFTFLSPKNPPPRALQRIQHPIDLAAITGGRKAIVDSSDVIALFVLDARVCPPCLVEVDGYVERIRQAHNKRFRVTPLALVVDDDSIKATRFLKVSKLPLPAKYVRPEVPVSGQDTLRFGDLRRRLIFIDVKKEQGLWWLPLPNSVITPNDYKQAVLQAVLSE